MRLLLVTFLALSIPTAGNAQSHNETVLDAGLARFPEAMSIVHENWPSAYFHRTEDAAEIFCASSTDRYSALIMSRRLRPHEATTCSSFRGENLFEFFNHQLRYLYMDMDSSQESIQAHLSRWFGFGAQQAYSELNDSRWHGNRPLEEQLLTNSPETCSRSWSTFLNLACGDETYCCKGECIPNDEPCE